MQGMNSARGTHLLVGTDILDEIKQCSVRSKQHFILPASHVTSPNLPGEQMSRHAADSSALTSAIGRPTVLSCAALVLCSARSLCSSWNAGGGRAALPAVGQALQM